MIAPEKGYLLIADIGGYTKFLTAVELEHSTDILADLINSIVAQAAGAFQLAKLEGDAVFVFAPEGSIDGPAFITLVESCYFAFAERLRDISRANTCECGACRLTPSLNLKFVAHAGQYSKQTMAGSMELVGPDVIVVHRLLKNYVVEKTGKKGYAFFSDALVKALDLDAERYNLLPHSEHYDDVGEVPGLVLDLEQSWQDHLAEQRVVVSDKEALFTMERVFRGTPAQLWDYFNSPEKMKLWGADSMTEVTPQKRGVGTQNHCVHGPNSVMKTVLDWKPFKYMTEASTMKGITFESTYELLPEPDGAHTKLISRTRAGNGGVKGLATRLFIGKQMRKGFDHALANLAAVLEKDLGGLNDQDAAGGVVGHAVGHAAEKEAPDAGHALVPDHDEVRA